MDRYIDAPTHRDAWLSAFNRSSVLCLRDTEVRNPTFLRKPSNQLQPSEYKGNRLDPEDPSVEPPKFGFTLTGEIDLFGIKTLPARISSWHGPPPPDTEVDEELPVCEQVEINNLPIRAILPWVADTPLGMANLSDVTLTYQNYPFDASKGIGMSISGRLLIDEQFGALSKLLNDVLRFPPELLSIQVSSSFGFNDSWSSLPSVSNLVFQGLLHVKDPTTNAYRPITLCDGVLLSDARVRLSGITTPAFGPVGSNNVSYRFGLFGQLALRVPGSQNPLDFSFDISESDDTMELSAILVGDTWENALGLGLDLESTTLSSSFGTSSPPNGLDFKINALLDADTASTSLFGSYSVGGDFTLSAEIEDFGCEGVFGLFRKLTGEEIDSPPDEELVIGSAVISMSNTSGLSVVVKDIEYGRYVASSGTLHLSSTEAILRATPQDIDFPEYRFKLIDAVLAVSFQKPEANKLPNVKLDAVVQLDGVQNLPKIAGTVHVYREPQDTELQWTVYGTFDGIGSSAKFGELIPELDGSFLGDVELKDLMVVIASKDEPSLSAMNPQRYPIKQGVQICAVLDKINQIEQLLHHSTPGLVLTAAWSKDSGYTLNIAFPSQANLPFGHGITTGPIELQVKLNPIRLMVKVDVRMPIPGPTNTLDFRMGLGIEKEEVYVSYQMTDVWRNPLGISPRVQIEPNAGLELRTNLHGFSTTGLHTNPKFSGELSIGSVKGVVQIGNDPDGGVIGGHFDHLGIQDVVSFTSEIINVDLPLPPDFINFENVTASISTKTTDDVTVFDKEVSFEGKIRVFGTETQASAKVTENALVADASLPPLHVGPFMITGVGGNGPNFNLEISSSVQRVSVKGVVSILGIEEPLCLDLTLLPTPEYALNFTVHLTPMLIFTIVGRMKGEANLEDLSKLDFQLHALMEQDVLDYVRSQVVQTLELSKTVADLNSGDVKSKLSRIQEDWKKRIQGALREHDEQYQRWRALDQEVQGKSTKLKEDYTVKLAELQNHVDEAQRNLKESVQYAEVQVRAAYVDRAAKLRAAEAAVTKAKNDWDSKIATQERAREEAGADLWRTFGSVGRDIEMARAKVDKLREEADELKNQIYVSEHGDWYEFWKKVALPISCVELGNLQSNWRAAEETLQRIESLFQDPEYVERQRVVNERHIILDHVKAGDDGLTAAENVLEKVDKLTQAAIEEAEQARESARVAGGLALGTARKGLNDAKETLRLALQAAQETNDALVRSPESLAYQTAKEAFDVAKHGSFAFDVVLATRELSRTTRDETADIAEKLLTDLAHTFCITKIEVTADLGAFYRTFSFNASVRGEVSGEVFDLDLVLDLRNTSTFIHEICSRVIKGAAKEHH